MASAGNSLIKGALVLLFVGAVFAGLNFFLEEAPEEAPAATTISTPGSTAASDEDPAVTEARQLGAQIGQQVGEAVGRRVGELLVASLDAEGEGVTASSEPEEMMVADAGEEPAPDAAAVEEDTSATDSMEEESETAEADAAPVAEEAMEPVEETPLAEEPVTEEPLVEDEAEESAPSEDKPAFVEEPERPIVTQTSPGIVIPTVRTEPDKGEGTDDGKWWTASANSKGPRIIYVGQSVTSDYKKSIAVIVSSALASGQDLNSLIQVQDDKGNSVAGEWRISSDSRSLFYRVKGSGTYQLSFSSALKDTDGDSLGMDLSGPAEIR